MYHIKCSKVSERVIVCGDPFRTKKIASFLENPKLINENRCLLTYTGIYKDKEITVSTTGMGTPSAAIVIEELIKLGAKIIIRVGTTGSAKENIEVGDIIVPTLAIPLDGTTNTYLKRFKVNTKANEELIEIIKKFLKGYKYHIGPICTSDVFYLEEEEKDVLSYDMECSIIFAIANIRNCKAAAILTVNGKAWSEPRIIENDKVNESINVCIKVALNTLASI
ncbi:MAG: nucleoside phosphorylase [Candidatus Verstraetearchaeota archaeon]|jgi:DeoD family purine-nucleoside phosphorylase|nr:nucleoside phosphorylase [Candidatus Verstraetearchaeota archaeon]